jgi:hypothetical protein
MELWIRSQDKEKLLKVNDIAIEMNMIYGYFDKNTEYEHLGTYATKERALEVLDEIQSLLYPNTIIKINGDMQSNVIRVLLDKFKDYSPIAIKDNDIKVEPIGELLYVMPEE